MPTPSPTRSLTLTRTRCPTRRFRTDVRYGRIQIFFNPQLFLCGFGFRPQVCGVLIRHSNPQLFESALHRVESFEYATIRNRVDAKSGYFLSSVDLKRSDGPVLPLNFSRRRRAQFYRFFSSWTFSFKSYNVCAVKPSYDYCTLLIMPNGGSTFWSFFTCRTDELDAVN